MGLEVLMEGLVFELVINRFSVAVVKGFQVLKLEHKIKC